MNDRAAIRASFALDDGLLAREPLPAEQRRAHEALLAAGRPPLAAVPAGLRARVMARVEAIDPAAAFTPSTRPAWPLALAAGVVVAAGVAVWFAPRPTPRLVPAPAPIVQADPAPRLFDAVAKIDAALVASPTRPDAALARTIEEPMRAEARAMREDARAALRSVLAPLPVDAAAFTPRR